MINDNKSEKFLELIKSNRLDNAIKFWKSQVPEEFLYKFFKLGNSYDETMLKELEKGFVYFNYPYNFKDKNELRNVKFMASTQIDQEIANNIMKQKLSKNLISCFCICNADNQEHMWTEYGNSGNGILVRFKLIDNSPFYPVCYSDNDIYIKPLEDCLQPENSSRYYKNLFLYEHLSFCLKKKEWEIENEYRMILDCEGNPFTIADHYQNLNKYLKIDSIIAGENVSNDNMNILKNIVTNLSIELKTC